MKQEITFLLTIFYDKTFLPEFESWLELHGFDSFETRSPGRYWSSFANLLDSLGTTTVDVPFMVSGDLKVRYGIPSEVFLSQS